MGRKALVEAGEQPLQLTSTGRSCPTGYWLAGFALGQDQYPSSTPPFSLNQSEGKSFALDVFSFVSVGFGCYS